MPATTQPPYRQRVIDEVDDVPEEYLPGLLRVVSAFRESVAFAPAKESLRRGWDEVQSGQLRPVSDLWDGIDG